MPSVGGNKILISYSNSVWNFALNDMCWYGVYIDLIDDSDKNYDCVGVKRYILWNWSKYKYSSYIHAYHSAKNFTLNPNFLKFFWNPNFHSAHAFWKIFGLKNLRGWKCVNYCVKLTDSISNFRMHADPENDNRYFNWFNRGWGFNSIRLPRY